MQQEAVTLDEARNLLVCGLHQFNLPSGAGSQFLIALLKASKGGYALTFDHWCGLVQGQGHSRPNRTAMRRRIAELERCFKALGCLDSHPAVMHPPRASTVGPWALRADLAARLVVIPSEEIIPTISRFASLTKQGAPAPVQLQLKVLRSFLVGDDLARNGVFFEAAASMSKALEMPDLSLELRCVLLFRRVKYLRRAGHYREAQLSLVEASCLTAGVALPMRLHLQAELAMQGARLKYDDVAHPEHYGESKPPHANAYQDMPAPGVDSRLMWQRFNLWASAWRRQMETNDVALTQTAFNHAQRGYEAAIYWTLASEDPLNLTNVLANMGYLLHRSGEKRLEDLSVDALEWLLLSHAYVERFEWPEESIWGYVFLSALYLSSVAVRSHLKAQAAFTMNTLTPDTDKFYIHAIALGIRFGEPRQLADIYKSYVLFLQSTGRQVEAKVQTHFLDALLDQNPGLREKLAPPPLNPSLKATATK